MIDNRRDMSGRFIESLNAVPLPTTIKIGPYHYTVRADGARMAKIRKDLDSPSRVGHIDFATLTIDLDPTLAPDRLAETLLHEVLHGVMQIGLPFQGKVDNETTISVTAPILLAVLRENPDLVAFLLGHQTSFKETVNGQTPTAIAR